MKNDNEENTLLSMETFTLKMLKLNCQKKS